MANHGEEHSAMLESITMVDVLVEQVSVHNCRSAVSRQNSPNGCTNFRKVLQRRFPNPLVTALVQSNESFLTVKVFKILDLNVFDL